MDFSYLMSAGMRQVFNKNTFMLWRDLIRITWQELRKNGWRTFFTILGIVIGVGSIIIVVSLGEAAEELIVGELSGLGSQTVLVAAGREPKGPADILELLTDTLKEREYEALQDSSRVRNVVALSPIIFQPETSEYAGETERGTLIGSNEELFHIFQVYPVEGRIFSVEETRNRASIVVLGSKIKDELFGPSDAVGEMIKIKGRSFRVIGVLPSVGNITIFNVDEFMVIPYTTVQDYIIGTKYYNRIILEASSNKVIPLIVRDIEATLRELHDITDPSKDDFFVDTQADAALRVQAVTDIFATLLIAVATISLIVGGVGIMNIMLVSVTERTKEIGILKAVGATKDTILEQFLLESVLITTIGGIIGMIFGVFFSYSVSLFMQAFVNPEWKFVFPVSAVFIGVFVSVLIGVVFGIYPARKAARKDPIESLWYEQ